MSSQKRALGVKNKLEFVDGSIEFLDEYDLNYAQWECCNHIIHSWIINSKHGYLNFNKNKSSISASQFEINTYTQPNDGPRDLSSTNNQTPLSQAQYE
ncbi:hypothetical protein KIW84_042058 [Lathyrus oleraceus]|uniref:Uncharacterized protein n=1 Tax=Pisum sativum TaxID=3888 RepID=A0A9D4XDD7_PEA|nr:hypothetical protein KIW84_042058 [Pisum sativum]